MNFDTPNLVDEEDDFYLENADMEHEDFVMFNLDITCFTKNDNLHIL